MRKFFFYPAVTILVWMIVSIMPFRPVSATGLIAGATEPTQIANNVELVLQYAKQSQQYSTQLRQYQDQLNNSSTVPDHVWSSVQNDLIGVMNVVRQGEALAFSLGNIGEQFKLKFPGFKASTDYSTDYRAWSQTLRDTIRGTLEAANLQSQQFSTEERIIAQLRAMSSSNQGRLQALQTGNQIAVEVAAQLQKLRALSMTQIQAQSAYMAKNEQEKDTENAGIEFMLKRVNLEQNRKYNHY